jgi:hypothetical protein
MTPKTYLLPEDVRNAILGYLVSRPYAEVARGVQMLEGLRVVPEQPSQPAAATPEPSALPPQGPPRLRDVPVKGDPTLPPAHHGPPRCNECGVIHAPPKEG